MYQIKFQNIIFLEINKISHKIIQLEMYDMINVYGLRYLDMSNKGAKHNIGGHSYDQSVKKLHKD